jgi:hypothetical protein
VENYLKHINISFAFNFAAVLPTLPLLVACCAAAAMLLMLPALLHCSNRPALLLLLQALLMLLSPGCRCK